MTTTTHTIDAQGRALGRVASEVATLLMGKHLPTYERHIRTPIAVHVTHASKLALTPKKKQQHTYTHYTGYPGGLRQRSMAKVIEEKGHAEVLRRAVYGMLPSNKLRAPRMKQLTIDA